MKKSDSKQPATVTEYLDELQDDTRTVLTKLRKAILAAAPKATERMAYRIPVYRINGDIVAFAAFKAHCSLVTMSSKVIGALKNELDTYKISGTTIQFRVDRPLPQALVRKIVKLRIKEDRETINKKQDQKNKKKNKVSNN
jgi:uncharacterized protein YdhG (YjbR/CyaY superfamily)